MSITPFHYSPLGENHPLLRVVSLGTLHGSRLAADFGFVILDIRKLLREKDGLQPFARSSRAY